MVAFREDHEEEVVKKEISFADPKDEADDDEDEAVITSFMARMGSNISDNGGNNPPGSSSTSLRNRLPTTLPSSYQGRNSLYLFSNECKIPSDFDFDKSTQENYAADSQEFYGPFEEFRASLDFSYHGNYTKERQAFQDKIVQKCLGGTMIYDRNNGIVGKKAEDPWMVFTAGVMGAGKGYAMGQISSRGDFPVESYVTADPDDIRSHFPEYHLFAVNNPKLAGDLTHREAGYITEIVSAAALKRGFNVMVDGSLRDWEWYQGYFDSLKKDYAKLRIAILHITAPRETVFERAKKRGKLTGRVVPIETLELCMKQVPISVSKLSPKVDFFCELDNSPLLSEVEVRTEGVTWESFKANWVQSVHNVPGQRRLGLIRKTYINALDPKDFESKRLLSIDSIDDDDDEGKE